jgi:hypothetical protein
MNSQNASVSLLGRDGSEFGITEAGDVNEEASGEVTRALGLSIQHLAAFAE